MWDIDEEKDHDNCVAIIFMAMGFTLGSIICGCSVDACYRCDVCGKDVTRVGESFKRIGENVLCCEKCWKEAVDRFNKKGGE